MRYIVHSLMNNAFIPGLMEAWGEIQIYLNQLRYIFKNIVYSIAVPEQPSSANPEKIFTTAFYKVQSTWLILRSLFNANLMPWTLFIFYFSFPKLQFSN